MRSRNRAGELIAPFKSTKVTLTALIVLVHAGLFFSIPVSNVTILMLLLFCVINTPLTEIPRTIRTQPLPMIVLLVYVVLTAGLLYTSNKATGLFALEKKLSLLLAPVVTLSIFHRHQVAQSNIFRWTGYITLGSSFLLLVIAGYKSLVMDDDQAFYFENFTQLLMAYVYYALYFAVGMLCLLECIFDDLAKSKQGILILSALFIYSLSFLVLVASKTGILAFSLAAIFLLYRRIQNKQVLRWSLGAMIVSASLLLYFNETTRSRFTELTENLSILTRDQLGNFQQEKLTGLNMRLLFWKLSVTHVWQDGAALWGVGTGDTQDYLNVIYTDPRHNREGYVNWDTHNEWIFTFVQTGLIGVALWAALYFVYFRKAWKAADLKFLVFLFVTFAFSMSESILESNKGIVFFALYFTVFASSYPRVETPTAAGTL